jgi:hypothetical protein
MRAILGLGIALIISAAASAGGLPVNVQTQKDGKQSITTLVPVQPGAVQAVKDPVQPPPKASAAQPGKAPGQQPPQPGKDPPVIPLKEVKFPDGTATGVILDGNDWYAGRWFTDQYNRRWQMIYGVPTNDRLMKMAGWEIDTKAKGLMFVTTTGDIFRYIGIGASPPKVVMPIVK